MIFKNISLEITNHYHCSPSGHHCIFEITCKPQIYFIICSPDNSAWFFCTEFQTFRQFETFDLSCIMSCENDSLLACCDFFHSYHKINPSVPKNLHQNLHYNLQRGHIFWPYPQVQNSHHLETSLSILIHVMFLI